MLIDLSPLRASRDYRLLFVGQLVSFFGSMMTFVVGPWQIGAALILPKFASYDGREGIKLGEIEEAERAEMTRVSEADF